MHVVVKENAYQLGKTAGKFGADLITKAISRNGYANIILATGASQFETLNELIQEKNIDWSKVKMFHLDEYIGIPESHKASFRKYLKERFLNKVPHLASVVLIDGEVKPEEECNRIGDLIRQNPVDVAFIGIGENGHIAFNDPPADFDTEKPYLVLDLDTACKQQQVNEGWFESLEEVPKQAISMSVRQIMLSKQIVCSVPDRRKAEAVKNCLEQPVSNLFPASILQRHPNCTLFLDKFSAELLHSDSMTG